MIGLCALYNRHCLVFTKNKFWSSLDTTAPIGFMKLLQQCSVKLIFLGELKFGLLNWKPRPPKPSKSTVTVPHFSIVEEYTLDDSPPESAPIDLTKNIDARPVEMSPSIVQGCVNIARSEPDHTLDSFSQKELLALPVGTIPNTPANLDPVNPPSTPVRLTPTSEKTSTVHDNVQLPVGTDSLKADRDVCTEHDSVNTLTSPTALVLPPTLNPAVEDSVQLPVGTDLSLPQQDVCSDLLYTCPDDGLVLSQYPWKKSAILKVKRLSELTIDVWCNSVSEYYQYVPVSLSANYVNTGKLELTIKKENKTSGETPDVNYDDETDVDIDNLLHHAESLVRKVKDELNPEKETSPHADLPPIKPK